MFIDDENIRNLQIHIHYLLTSKKCEESCVIEAIFWFHSRHHSVRKHVSHPSPVGWLEGRCEGKNMKIQIRLRQPSRTSSQWLRNLCQLYEYWVRTNNMLRVLLVHDCLGWLVLYTVGFPENLKRQLTSKENRKSRKCKALIKHSTNASSCLRMCWLWGFVVRRQHSCAARYLDKA